MAEPEIYCPCCSWRPGAMDRWQCSRGGCGCVWNTFWTGGVCPGCGYQWRNTQCLVCQEFSRHADWYHYPPDAEREAEEAREREKVESR